LPEIKLPKLCLPKITFHKHKPSCTTPCEAPVAACEPACN
jgi:hypothetical protein